MRVIKLKLELELSVNDSVLVRLTEVGEKTWCEYYIKSGVRPAPLQKDKRGRCEFSLWQLMNIFGPKTYIREEQQFVDNKIYLKS